MESQTHTEVIRAPLDTCFETLVDFEKYPEWFRVIKTATLEKADPEAGCWTVRFTLDAILKTITYTLAYECERPHKLTWKMVAGDLSSIHGSYELVELEPGLTEATCTQTLEVGVWVPGMIRRAFEQTAIVESVRELKKAAEDRAGN